MVTDKIDITPEDLLRAMNEVNEVKRQWAKDINVISVIAQQLASSRTAFVGLGGAEFAKKMLEYHKSFQAAEKTLNDYIQCVNDYANDMKKADEEAMEKASHLSSGFANR